MAQEAEKISVIAAIGKNRAIGKDNQLLWQVPGDLPRFKQLTSGHPVIMGRRTWESIPEKFRPLPGRTNIVITRDSSYNAPGAVLAQSFPEALSRARDAQGSEEIFTIGGQQVYECALPFATNLYLTLIDEEKDGDAFFPAYDDQFSKEVLREEQESGGLRYTWLNLER